MTQEGVSMLVYWFSSLRIVLAIALGLIVPLMSAMAENVTWQTIRVKGEGTSAACGPESVATAYSGDSAAFVFSKLGVNLAAGVPHETGAEFGACRIRARIVIPRGYYLAGVTQSSQAGVIKTAGARGEIRTVLAVQAAERFQGMRMPAFPGTNGEGKIIESRVRFAPRDEMNEPLLNLGGSFATPLAGVRYMCQYSRQSPIAMDVEFRAAVRGQRRKPGSSVIIAVDSADVQLHVDTQVARCSGFMQ